MIGFKKLLITMNAKIRTCLLYLLFGSVFAGKNLKNFGNSFSCGKLFYRSLSYIENHDKFLVGSMDWIFRLNMENINLTSCDKETDVLNINSISVKNCLEKGLSKDYDCHNHISIIRKGSEGDTVYFCATNAYDPTLYSITLPKGKEIKSMKDLNLKHHELRAAKGRCSMSPEANYTYMEIDGMAFSGSAVYFKDSPMEYSRHALNVNTMKEVQRLYISSKFFESPHFAASFAFDVNQIFFMFREFVHRSDEQGPHGLYGSKIGAICTNEQGRVRDGYNAWGSFLKAEIICRSETTDYNEIQDAVTVNYDNRIRLVALFTKQYKEDSALCEYDMSKREDVFNGPFRSSRRRRNLAPIESHLESDRHPFDCPKKNENVQFLEHSYEMENSFRESPRHETSTDFLTKIAIIKIFESEARLYNIYVGTIRGEILQMVYFMENEQLAYYVYNIIEISPAEPIRAMIFIEKQKTLYVSSDSAVHQFDLSQCEKRFDNCLECIRDHLCSWDTKTKKCSFGENGLLERYGDFFSNKCENYVKMHYDIAKYGEAYYTKCKSVFATHSTESIAKVHKLTSIIWYQCDNANSPKSVDCQDTNKYSCENQTLNIKSVNKADEGCYKCKLMDSTLYIVTVAVLETVHDYFVVIKDQTQRVECQNSVIETAKILANDISWVSCNGLDNKALKNNPKKYSYENYSLVIQSVKEEDMGCYACHVTVRKEIFSLYTFNLIVVTPQHYVATPGETARLTCKNSAYQKFNIPMENIVWETSKNGENFKQIEKSNKYSFENHILIIESVSNQDIGYYNCKTNEKLVYSYVLKIVNVKPELYILKYASTANLLCKNLLKVKGSVPAKIEWFKSIDLEKFTKIEEKKNKITMSKNNKLIIRDVDNNDEKYYYCRSNETNLYSYNLKVVIILEVPRLKVVNTGQSALLKCNNALFDKIDIIPNNITWHKCDDTKIIFKTKKHSVKNYELTIYSTNNEDKGCYSCKLKEISLRKIDLLILNITFQTYDAALGRKANIVCNHPRMREADIPAKNITWHHCNNEQNVTQLKNDRFKYSFKNFTLIILTVKKEDLGCYTCKSGEVTLVVANLTLPPPKLPKKSRACGKKFTFWKYIFVMHVFIMVVKLTF